MNGFVPVSASGPSSLPFPSGLPRLPLNTAKSPLVELPDADDPLADFSIDMMSPMASSDLLIGDHDGNIFQGMAGEAFWQSMMAPAPLPDDVAADAQSVPRHAIKDEPVHA